MIEVFKVKRCMDWILFRVSVVEEDDVDKGYWGWFWGCWYWNIGGRYGVV